MNFDLIYLHKILLGSPSIEIQCFPPTSLLIPIAFICLLGGGGSLAPFPPHSLPPALSGVDIFFQLTKLETNQNKILVQQKYQTTKIEVVVTYMVDF